MESITGRPLLTSATDGALARLVWQGSVPFVLSALADGRILDANPACCRLLGLPANEVVGRTAADLGFWADADERAAFVGAMRAAGRPADRIVSLRAGDGGLRELLVSGEIAEIDGRTCLLSQLVDVTERRRLERELLEREQRFRAVFDHAAGFIAMLSPDGTVLEVNRTTLAAAGLAAEDVVGRPVWEAPWLTGSPDAAARVREGVAAAGRGEAQRRDLRMRRGDGAPWVVDLALTPVRDAAGAVTALVAEARDETAVRELQAALQSSEERFRAFIDTSPAVAWIKDEDLRIAYVNRRLAELYGRPGETLVGATDFDFQPAASAAAVRANDNEVLRSGQAMVDVEMVPTPDGERRLWLVHKFPFADADGRRFVGGVGFDVTDRERTERLLRESEARFQGAFDNAPIGMALVDPDGRWLRVNPALCALLGYAEEELRALSFQDVTHPDDLALDEALVARTLAGEIPGYRLDKRYRRRDGAVVWAELVVSLVRDEAGAPRFFVSQVHDVTKRRVAEMALRESEARQRALLTALPDLVFRLDRRGVYLDVAAHRAEDLAAPSDEIVGRSLADVLPPPLAERLLGSIERVADGGSMEVVEYDLELGAGPRAFEARLVAADAGEVVAVVRDVTDRAAAVAALADERDLLQTLIDAVPDPIYVKDAAHRFVRVNRAQAASLGAASPAAAAGKTDHDFFPPALADGFRLAEARLLATGDPIVDRVERLDEGGEGRWMLDYKAPWRDRSGRITGLIGSSRDVTALVRAQRAAEASSYLKSTFLASMSHELRTPMTAIIGYSDLLLEELEGPLTDQQRIDVEAIARGAQRLLRLINDLLDLSRIESGRLELELSEVDLREVVALVRDDVAPQAAAKGVRLEIDLPAWLPPVAGDPHRLRQVVLNMVGNAVKFTPRGQVRITARARPDGGVEVAVADTGIGIAPHALPHVFDEFRQADTSTTRAYGGSGLGLAISRKLAELHGGAMGIASELGAGTTVALALPAPGGPPPPLRPLGMAAPTIDPPIEPPAAGKPVVLVVENDPSFADLIRRRVEAEGAAVLVTGSGLEALRLAAAHPPALVLLDLLLDPPLDGWQVLNGLRNRPATARTPVVVLTVVDDAATALALGASEHLLKPAPPEAVIAALRRHLPPPPD
jgi:PAS domain S-box-containing protein